VIFLFEFALAAGGEVEKHWNFTRLGFDPPNKGFFGAKGFSGARKWELK